MKILPMYENAPGTLDLVCHTAKHFGFRLVLEPRGEDWLVITAFFSRGFRRSADLPHLAPALRAFAARRNCPPEGPSGVRGGEPTS